MRSFFSSLKARCLRHRGALLSVSVHLALLLCFVSGVRWSPRVAPYRLPGTALGVSTLTYYSPGSPRSLTSNASLKSLAKTKAAPMVRPVAATPEPEKAHAVQAETGLGTSAKSGLGEGDITIALLTYYPHPAPDLSALPHGTKGDVILNAVIDESGKISELTLLKGLGSPVDETVIATVQQWHFTPAMRNGVPVVSEQELHFHYERG